MARIQDQFGYDEKKVFSNQLEICSSSSGKTDLVKNHDDSVYKM